jgi:hypothetical protein
MLQIWMLHMLQCDPPATTSCCNCWGVVHTCGEQRDGALVGGGCGRRREMAAGA